MAEKKIPKDIQEKLAELQMLQQRLQVFAQQKQQFQIQLVEVSNALEEVSKTKKPVYKLLGEILVESSAADVKKELQEKKDEFDLRIKSIEKQEERSQKKAMDLQQEVAKVLESK